MRGVGYVCVWDSYQILSVYKKNKYVSGVRFICYCHDQRRLGKCCCSIEHFAKVLDRWIAMKYNFIEFNLYKQIYLKGSVAATAHIDHWCWVVQRSVILATQPEGKLSGHHGWTDGHGRLCLRCAFAEKCHYPLAFLVWCNLSFDVSFIPLACRIICEGMMAKITIVYTHIVESITLKCIDHTHQGTSFLPHYWFHFNPGPLAVSESGSETVDRTVLARRSSHGIGGLWPFERPSDGCQGEPAADWNKIPDKAVLSNWRIMTPSDSNCHIYIYRYKYILSNFGNDALGALCMNISNVLSGIGHCSKGLRGWKTIPGKW